MATEDSFIGKTFGDKNQITVVGWFGEKSGSNKKYTVECAICKEDTELFGDGRFLVRKKDLLKGTLPCGCSDAPRWTKEQYEIKLLRLCEESDFKFLGWYGEYRGIYSRVLVSCPVHGQLEHKSINDFLSGRRCIECRRDLVKHSMLIDEQKVVDMFFSTGAFHSQTKFWRSDRLKPHPRYREGYKPYWNVICGQCGEHSETLYSTLKAGGSSCGCFFQKQRFAYINFVYDEDFLIAVKFGITSNTSRRREREQNINSSLRIEHFATWEFPNVVSCKRAEKEVKHSVQTSVVDKELMKDGWTETCWPHEIDKIIKIYEDLGGTRL